MSIDWFTVVAQVLNFLVLVWLLKRFLYRPVLDAVERRQERVRKSLSDAAEQESRSREEREGLERERRQLETTREEAVRAAREEAEAERRKLIGEAREEYEESRARWRRALESEAEEFQRELARQAHGEVIEIADQLLRDLADTELQGRIVKKFLRQLADLAPEQKAVFLQERGNRADQPPVIRSAFPLPGGERESLVKAVRDLFGEEAMPVFETDPDLGCGIELSVEGHKIAWTLEDYLQSLDTWVNSLVTEQRRRHAGAG